MLYLNRYDGPLCYFPAGEEEEGIVLLFTDYDDIECFVREATEFVSEDFFEEAYPVEADFLNLDYVSTYWKQVPADILFGKENN